MDLLGIGRMAAASGLGISALRFYDSAGILVPASVDPANGYRRYAADQVPAARLIASLRRVGLPLPEIRRILNGPVAAAQLVLDEHLRRLEDGLADARRELSTVRALLEPMESLMTTIALSVQALLDALAEVRFAVSEDPELPMLGGVLFDSDASCLRLVATDRYRLAVSELAAEPTGEPQAALVPVALVDRVARELAGQDGPVTIVVSADEVTFSCSDKVIAGQRLQQEYPHYRGMLQPAVSHRLPVEVAAFRQAIRTGPTRSMTRDGADYQLSVLQLTETGLRPVDEPAGELSIGLNQEFLLQALAAGSNDQLMLELDGPIGPLAIRNPDRSGSFSILMPVRLD